MTDKEKRLLTLKELYPEELAWVFEPGLTAGESLARLREVSDRDD